MLFPILAGHRDDGLKIDEIDRIHRRNRRRKLEEDAAHDAKKQCSLNGWRFIGAHSLREAHNVLVDLTKDGSVIVEIVILGHGRPGGIRIGGTGAEDDDNRIVIVDGPMGRTSPNLDILLDGVLIDENASIDLGGCNCLAEKQGKALYDYLLKRFPGGVKGTCAEVQIRFDDPRLYWPYDKADPSVNDRTPYDPTKDVPGGPKQPRWRRFY